jgi:large subunit ribosomal protein L29
MKTAELRQMKTEELHGELDRLRRHFFDLSAQAVTEKLENPNQLGQTRRDIARIFTLLRERLETEPKDQGQYHREALATHRRGG